jgi:hypothetical protein
MSTEEKVTKSKKTVAIDEAKASKKQAPAKEKTEMLYNRIRSTAAIGKILQLFIDKAGKAVTMKEVKTVCGSDADPIKRVKALVALGNYSGAFKIFASKKVDGAYVFKHLSNAPAALQKAAEWHAAPAAPKKKAKSVKAAKKESKKAA